MNVYPIYVNYNGERVQLDLKLDVKNIRALQKQYDDDILGIIGDAATNPGKLADLIGATLNWRNNKNKLRNGDDVFDLMVEGGEYCGPVDWTKVVGGIAAASGLLRSDYTAAMAESTERKMQQIMDNLGSDTASKESDDPPPAAGK